MLTTVLVICSVHSVLAQAPSEAEVAKSVRRANVKLAIGILTLGAAVFVLPATAGDTGSSPAARRTALGLVGLGSGLTLWGLRERYKAVRPSTTIAVSAGHTRIVQIVRTW